MNHETSKNLGRIQFIDFLHFIIIIKLYVTLSVVVVGRERYKIQNEYRSRCVLRRPYDVKLQTTRIHFDGGIIPPAMELYFMLFF